MTQKDIQTTILKELREFKKETIKRFESIDQRFDGIDQELSIIKETVATNSEKITTSEETMATKSDIKKLEEHNSYVFGALSTRMNTVEVDVQMLKTQK